MTGIKKKLVARTKKSNLIFTRELHPPTHNGGWTILDKQDHLVCFLGGSLLLGITEGGHRDIDWNNLNVQDNEDFVVGTGLIESCVNTYQSASGLGSEIVMFVGPDASDSAANVDWYVKDSGVDMRYILRPETVESLFLAWRTTGDQKYRDWGWQIFNAFQKQCRVSTGGYANIKDVRVNPAEKEDRMETFWVAETLSACLERH